jgi:hypothetical protein
MANAPLAGTTTAAASDTTISDALPRIATAPFSYLVDEFISSRP